MLSLQNGDIYTSLNVGTFRYRVNRPLSKSSKTLYDKFFNPNVCHVCKSRRNGNLIPCTKCNLIFYCNDKHRSKHQAEHSEFCGAVTYVIKHLSIMCNKPKDKTHELNTWNQWIETREDLVKLTREKISKPLKEYEERVILLAKTCAVCYQTKQLLTCEKCLSANYCADHCTEFRKEHSKDECNKLTILFNLDIETCDITFNLSYTFLDNVNSKTKVESSFQFFTEHIQCPRKNINWLATDYILCELISKALTMYFVLKKFNFTSTKEEYIIHIIGATLLDKKNVRVWELLLHLLPKLCTLIIVLTGLDDKYQYHEAITVCSSCKSKSKGLHVITDHVSYYDYIQSHNIYRKANIVAGFHTQLNKIDEWEKSIKKIQNHDCPLVLCYSTHLIAKKYIKVIRDVLDIHVKPVFNNENPFLAPLPYRDIEDNIVSFSNEKLVVFNNLRHSNEEAYSNTDVDME